MLNFMEYRDKDYGAADRMRRLRERRKNEKGAGKTVTGDASDVTRDSGEGDANSVTVRRNVTQAESREQRAEAESSTELIDSEESVELTAIGLTVWANAAVTERWGEQPSPMHHGSASAIVDELQRRGITGAQARASVYRQCRDSKRTTAPANPAYFGPGIVADVDAALKAAEARAHLAASGETPPAKPIARDGGARNDAAIDKWLADQERAEGSTGG